MSRAQVSRHYARILSQWPADRLRPEVPFQKLLQRRVDGAPQPAIKEANTAQAVPQTTHHDPKAEMQEVNALYSLLEGRYSQLYPVSQRLMEPDSAPDYYTRLEKEIEEVPDRTWFGNMAKRFGGMFRWK